MQAFRSRLLHVTSTSPLKWQYLPDAVLMVEAGKIRDMGPAESFRARGLDIETCEHRPGQLLVPGFIDVHVHAPQIDNIGALGEELLEWLSKYTFPAEKKYRDESWAEAAYESFIQLALSAGTTSAMVYATSHAASTQHLFAAARAIAGGDSHRRRRTLLAHQAGFARRLDPVCDFLLAICHCHYG